jgi:hypothetical protein
MPLLTSTLGISAPYALRTDQLAGPASFKIWR